MWLFLCYFVFKMKKEHRIEIIRYEKTFKQVWDDFVDEAKNATFLFRRNFMEYHHDRFEDHSLMLWVDGVLTALVPACKVETQLISHKGLTYGGLLVKFQCKFDLFQKLFIELLRYLKTAGFTHLEIRSLPSILGFASNDELAYLCSHFKGTCVQNMSSIIYLKKENTISKSIYRNAKKAQKNGVIVTESDDFSTFWNELLVPRLADRYAKSPVHSLEEIQYLRSQFPDEIVLKAAFYQGKMIAGTVLFLSKNFVKSQYIGSHSVYNKLGGIDLLHLEVLGGLPQDYFDFGSSIEPETGEVNKGLLAWKEQYGARTLTMPTFLFNIS